MKYCARCSRKHSGLCGIPPTAAQASTAPGPQPANPARTVRSERRTEPQRPPGQGKPAGKALGDLLQWSLQERQRLEATLKQPPDNVADYDVLLEQYDRLGEVIRQLRVQMLAGRRGAAQGAARANRKAA